MSTVSSIATLIITLASLAWIISILSLLTKRVFRKERFIMSDTLLLKNSYEQSKVITTLVILAVLVFFLGGNKTFLELIGHNSLEYENSGTYCYYVELSGENGFSTYTLPAQIRVESDSDDDGDGHRQYWRGYYIEKVYFDNGEFLDFTENIQDTSISQRVRLYDQRGNAWDCTILNEHAFCPHIEETSHVTTSSLVELILVLLIVLYNWIGCVALDKKNCEALKAPQKNAIPSANEETYRSEEMYEGFDSVSSAQKRENNRTGFDAFIDKYRKD